MVLSQILRRVREDNIEILLLRVFRALFFQFTMMILNRNRRKRYSALTKVGGLVLRDVQGNNMWLDTTDEGISRDLILDGIREFETTALIKNIIQPGDVVIDIGANIGYYALMEAKLVGSTGRVYAIEPSPENVKLLTRNF